MPNLVSSLEFVVRRILTTHYQLPTGNWRRRRRGFTLIEVVLSLLLILAILTVFVAAAGTYTTSRGTNLTGIATKIASRQLETLRKTAYASLPSCPSPAGCAISDSDLSKLPSATAKQIVEDYQASPDIKQVTVQVDWIVSGAAKNIKLDTLIYKYGL